jgi:Na+/H+ antiporter NhaD/arsenite permease-like protein
MSLNNSTLFNDSVEASSCIYDYCVEDTIYRKVFGTLIFFIVWPFIVQDIKFFPIGRPAAALVGATLMVVFVIAPQDQIFRVLGDRGNIQTICLLVGMMALSYYYDREGLLRIVSLWIFGKGKPFRHVLWKVCVLTAVLSALITNDATCVVITPLLLTEHKKQNRAQKEVLPLVMGIATSANIGSASTFFGNPQNAYIASNANLSLLIFFITSLPAAIIGLVLNIALLYAIYFKVIFRIDSRYDLRNKENAGITASGTVSEERFEQSVQLDQSHDPFSASELAAERNSSTQCGISTDWQHNVREKSPVRQNRKVYGGASLSTSLPNLSPATNSYETKRTLALSQASSIKETTGVNRKRDCVRKTFLGWLIFITVILIGLLAVPPQKHVEFNLGLVPIGVAVFTMLADTILNCKNARNVMVEIDWPVILMFYGLFVWLVGFTNTSLPDKALEAIQKYMDLSTVGGVLLFTVFVIVGSNILSNVPLVILLIGKINTFQCGKDDCTQLVGVLLAWVSTIAGNFTLIGSIANLIVAEKTRSCTGHNLTFFSYLKFGFVSTLIVLFTGLPLVYFSGRFVNSQF